MEITNHSYNSNEDSDSNINFSMHSYPLTNTKLSVTDWVAIFQYSLVFVLGVPGNGLVVWITACQMKRSVNTIWLQNLAVADLLCCLSVPFIIVYIILRYWPLGLFTCKLIPFINVMNMYASAFLLTLISIDRCMLVMKPVWSQNKRTLLKAYVACALVWILAAILSIRLLIFQNIRVHNGSVLCIYEYRLNRHHRQVAENFFVFCHLLTGFFIPCLVIIVCYTLMIHRVKLRFKHNTKMMKVAITVVIGFFVCCFPYNLATIILIARSPLSYTIIKFYENFFAMTFMNNCINPIIYVLVGKDFKSKLTKSLKVIMKNVLEEEETTHSDYKKTSLIPEERNRDRNVAQ